MAAQALYRRWRSQTFEDVVGQEHVTLTLRNALREGRISHAYLFAGPRGTGTPATIIPPACGDLVPPTTALAGAAARPLQRRPRHTQERAFNATRRHQQSRPSPRPKPSPR